MDLGARPLSLVPGLLERVHHFIVLCKEMSFQQEKCLQLSEHMSALVPLLQEMKLSQTGMQDATCDPLMRLMFALIRAEKTLQKIKRTSRVKRVFLSAQFAAELSNATGEILSHIQSLPIVQFRVSAERAKEVDELKVKLKNMEEEFQDPGTNKDEMDLAAELTGLLRSRSNVEATTSSGRGNVMEDLLTWMATRFESDVDTVRSEWQELKDEASLLREQMEYTAESKQKLEREFLRQVMYYIDKGTEQEDSRVSSHYANTSETSPPSEFKCSICFDLMNEPTVCASGCSFCRECITKWCNERPGAETCPVTRIQLQSDQLFPNKSLKDLIDRWKDGRLENIEPPLRVEVTSIREEIVEPPLETLSSLSSSGQENEELDSSLVQPDVVRRHVSSLRSNNLIEVRKSLRHLASIAQFSGGQREIYRADGIRLVAGLLDSENPQILEKATSVFESITFQVKTEDGSHLSHEERDSILLEVTSHALDSLIKILRTGNQVTRLRAAHAVVNLMTDEEFRDEVRRREGVVRGLFGLTNIASGVLFESEGKSLCIKGLAMLRGEKACYSPDSDDNKAVATALLRLAGSQTDTPRLIEEALEALSLLVSMVGPVACGSFLQKNNLIFLIRLFRSADRSLSRRGHSSSFALAQSSLLSSKIRKEALNILSELALADKLSQLLLDCGLSIYLLPWITNPEAEDEFLAQGVQLLWTSISKSTSPVSFYTDFQIEMKGLVSILAKRRTSEDCKVYLLSIFTYLFTGSDAGAIRESFLNNEGAAALETSADSCSLSVRKAVASIFRLLSEFNFSHKDLRSEGALRLLASLLADDSLSCRSQAVTALSFIIKKNRDWFMPVQLLQFERIVELLSSEQQPDCREATIIVLWTSFHKVCKSPRDANLDVLWKKTTIEALLGVIRGTVSVKAQLAAAELLVSLTVEDHSVSSFLLGERGGFYELKEFGLQQGSINRRLLQLLHVFSEYNDETRNCIVHEGGLSFLLATLERTSNKEELSLATSALKGLFIYRVALDTAIHEGIIERVIRCVSDGLCRFQLLELMEIIVNGQSTAEKVRRTQGIRILVSLLTLPAVDGVVKRLVAYVLSKILKYDQEACAVLREERGISPLVDLLTRQAERRGPEGYFGGRMESLVALSLAAENVENVSSLLQEPCIASLISVLSWVSSPSEEEELALKLLVRLSRSVSQSDAHSIFNMNLLAGQVVRVISSTSNSSSASIEDAIRLIRNLSLFETYESLTMLSEGEGVVRLLLEEGVVLLLLERIRLYDNGEVRSGVQARNFAQSSVIALERFMLIERGRSCFIEENGIPLLVRLLAKDAEAEAKKYALRVLSTVLGRQEDEKRRVCGIIWMSKVELMRALGDIFEHSQRSELKTQGAELLKNLMLYGPKSDVCRYIAETECSSKLELLMHEPACYLAAKEALDILNKFMRHNRSFPWLRLPRAS